MNDRPLIIYHNADLDGKGSAAIALRARKGEVDLHGMNYGDPIPWDKIDGRGVLYLVDFSFQPFEHMLKAKSMVGELVWIDHHESALADAEKYDFDDTHCRVAKAAIELTWHFFHPFDPPPQAVTLLGRYDVWKFERNKDNVLPFQYGMRLKECNPEDSIWDDVLVITMRDRVADDLIRTGRHLLAYQDQQNAGHARALAFEAEFAGYRAICMNKGPTNSQAFDSVYDPEKHDLMVSFYWSKKGFWSMHVYSTKPEIDAGAICKARGGGGHRGAAGYQTKDLPFKLG